MNTLTNALDFINESMFYSRPIPQTQKRNLTALITDRQGKPGAYSTMFAPFPKEDISHYRLFTGESPSPLSAIHIIGEECCRALLLLGIHNHKTTTAISKANEVIVVNHLQRKRNPKQTFPKAFFCCPKCTCGLWRHYSARTNATAEKVLSDGMKALKQWRNGKGGWTQFPAYYTLFTLLEIDMPQARKELTYAAKSCEATITKLRAPRGTYAQRRVDVLKRVLSLV
ncbi:MAG: hypothetical protein A2487_15705 [Candidatus Raymondbacteria bacterium RifOxyC12_full_50_8]|uniref:Uncharacterized protein n=1 Tax=Candidatus Raymondbacteria bacterium RIFOXYD12_FULL_49_13 TaxID=1817890 RepID=A0A1F7F9S9_UNCRA|nr:MAG: hypothetical protein A2248_07260 [Candidatus Raymondbacteria bacterium RIFOXYA2_FULL_49_16]OGJ95448.1 MAG: hypothetical protein A2487_15705 [Candidatus Raymondbacteria bacterium RifOxyC12_full_50_8]OGJ95649.1 MAG: hypothetical protein A2453_13255 [Candidatus Raymondbacteria bacterium RIFOXYC2_FULL_50_21]OGK02029.1 MAG: hypothetical protein A2350_21185 [Candidatus Raymondbacteria bacterium RifOxyB12_full_50_8]OGK03420.1 MAG: hypothetical protein A2519_15535 [Candidatus Raymondbacteria ba